MIEFNVSAPGKVILFGEHSVVYGKTAVAGSINLRTTLYFNELHPDEKCIHILMPEVKLEKTIDIEKIENTFFKGVCPQYNLHPDHYLQFIEKFVEDIGYENNSQKLCMQAIIFVALAIYQTQNIRTVKPFKIQAKTELYIGSGLGSSASFAVCIAACFLHYTNILLNKESELTYDCLKLVTKYAFDCEKIMHGTPSGIDNTICTYGSLLYFKKDECSIKFPCYTTMKVMLVNTKVQRSTKTLVESVRERKTKYPEIFDPIFEAMDNVAKEGLRTIKSIVQSPENNDQSCEEYNELGKLMEINQGLLSALGVSHPTLDTICMEAKGCNFSAKLTGAGGGGYAYVLIPHNAPEDSIEILSKKLTDHGFDVKLVTLGGTGVEIKK